jgi:hypothetical protein
MKKIVLFVAAAAVSLSIGGKAFADTNTATLVDKAGITPDHTILYPIHKIIDNLRISLAFGDGKKAEAIAKVAEERLGESEVMADKGKYDLSIQSLNEYNDKITEAQDKLENAIDKASNDTTDSAIKLDQLKAAESTIDNDQTYSIEVLKNIENKVSENAKETIAQVIELQTRKKEAIVAIIKERQTLLQDKNAVKDAENSLEQAKKSSDEQAVKTAEDALKQAQDALKAENQKFSQAIAAKKEVMKGGVGQLKKQARQTEDNQTNNATSGDNSTTPTYTTASTITSTSSTVTNNTGVTNNTNTDKSIEENKGQEMKVKKEKENKGQEMKFQKADSSAHKNNFID